MSVTTATLFTVLVLTTQAAHVFGNQTDEDVQLILAMADASSNVLAIVVEMQDGDTETLN